ncbi:FAS1-like dehydratase domain-containing protein [Nocardia cyriacigeorgica]|uniref:FAS1-like dehydratase domain-containing protein n=1 Tax=Nocardia cyriacigeorgica TaxID=135487 RepID=UPI0039806782
MEAAFDVAGLVGHRYRADDYYQVGRERIREYARAVQDFHPAHWSEDVADLGYTGLLAPTTFLSTAAMLANRKLLETVMTGFDMFVRTDQAFEMYKPVRTGDRLVSDVELSSVRRIAGKDLLTMGMGAGFIACGVSLRRKRGSTIPFPTPITTASNRAGAVPAVRHFTRGVRYAWV